MQLQHLPGTSCLEAGILECSAEKKKKAMVILSEIYGTNAFIREQGAMYQVMGFDIFCPNLLGRDAFFCSGSEAAYHHFIEHVGFHVYQEIHTFIQNLKVFLQNDIESAFLPGAVIQSAFLIGICRKKQIIERSLQKQKYS